MSEKIPTIGQKLYDLEIQVQRLNHENFQQSELIEKLEDEVEAYRGELIKLGYNSLMIARVKNGVKNAKRQTK